MIDTDDIIEEMLDDAALRVLFKRLINGSNAPTLILSCLEGIKDRAISTLKKQDAEDKRK